MTKQALFTTSWDDGHILDLRLAELLDQHGMQGTFYVPGRVAPGGCCNPDGFAVLPKAELRQLGARYEIGSHTLDHRSLDALGADEARHQVVAGKAWLEDHLGRAVPGFCYPNGHHDAQVRSIVRDSGFRYARTTEDLRDDIGADPFQMPVSMHFYPRRRVDVARGFVREERRRLGQWRWARRLPVFLAAVSEDNFAERFRRVADRVCARGGVLHLWGHSWEIERFGGWGLLDVVLGCAAERFPKAARVTNEAVAAVAAAAREVTPATAGRAA